MFYHFIRIEVLLFIILILLHPCLLSRYFQCVEDEPEPEYNPPSNYPQVKSGFIDHHLPQSECNSKRIFKKIINPYKDIVECRTPVKMFKSGCLRCAVCLAIAEQIYNSVEKIEIGNSDPKEEIDNIEKILKSVCTNGFQGFDLRNYTGHIILTKASLSTSHVSTKMNGRWQSKLREICSTYLKHFNVMVFYSILLQNSYNIEDYLCRGDGVFRECYNVNFKRNPSIEEDCQSEIPNFFYTVNCT